MALAGAWHITVQQFHLWRPLCRFWPLRSEVRELIVRLSRACRGASRSRRSHGCLFVNNGRQRSADAIATIVSDRTPRRGHGNTLQLYCGRRETRVSVLRYIPLHTNDHQHAVTVGSLNVRSLGNKYVALRDLIASSRLHFFAAVKSWHELASCPVVIAARHYEATAVLRRHVVRALRPRKPSVRTSTVAVSVCSTNYAILLEILRYLCIAQRSHLQFMYKAGYSSCDSYIIPTADQLTSGVPMRVR